VSYLVGPAFVRRDGGPGFVPLAFDERVMLGDTLRTEVRSNLEIKCPGELTAAMGPGETKCVACLCEEATKPLSPLERIVLQAKVALGFGGDRRDTSGGQRGRAAGVRASEAARAGAALDASGLYWKVDEPADLTRGSELLFQGSRLEALQELKRVAEQHPGSEEGATAEYLLAVGTLEGGLEAQGRALLTRFIADHPGSPWAARAKSYLAGPSSP
jgi:hypothetical protein